MPPQPNPVDQQTPNEGLVLSRVTINDFHHGKLFKFRHRDESGGLDSLHPQSRGWSRNDGSYPNRLEEYPLCGKMIPQEINLSY